jgi:small subunit ribosomal protein S1
MGQRGEWIPPSAPLSEGYWQALLRDGEYGTAAPTASQADLWEEPLSESAETSEGTVETTPVENPWERAQELMSREEVLELPVVGCNRGGLLVGWNGLRGFVPASHLLTLKPSAEEEARQEELRHFIGTRLSLKIIELDRDSDRFVLSERATQVDMAHRDDVLNDLKPGDVCEGRVTNLCPFGAFVDLGGFEGLVHISELSWGRVGHPSDVLEPGQTVTVYVLNVEPERERVGLSIKRLQPNPWQSVDDRYHAGQIVQGTVTHVVDFGAFVQIEEGLEGLIHVSELAPGNPCDPHDILHHGDCVSVEVLNVDGARRRMGLRLEQIQAGESEQKTSEHTDERSPYQGQ